MVESDMTDSSEDGSLVPPDSEENDDGVDDEQSHFKNDKHSEDHPGEQSGPPVTPETKEAGEDDSVASPIKESLSSDTGNSIDDGDDQDDTTDENGGTDCNATVETTVISNNWSETLKSPVHLLGFSPSEIGSNHGMGLKLAVERNTSMASSLGKISLFLSSVANLYEQLDVNLVKIAQCFSPQQLPLKPSVADDFQLLYETILSLGGSFKNSTRRYRTAIVASLQKTLSTNGNERDVAIKQYRETKQAGVEARKLASSYCSKTIAAAKAAEKEIKAWLSKMEQNKTKGTNEDGEETGRTIEILDSDLPWEKSLKLIGSKANEIESTKRVIQKLKLVESCKMQYAESVEKENTCVTLSQEKEGVALGEAQKAEEDQMNFFVKVILAQIFLEDENPDSMSIARPSITMNESDRLFAEGIEKKRILPNLNLFKSQTIPYEEGMGIMDAETLGLPDTLGHQRDKIKTAFSARENRIKITEVVLKLFEEIADVTSKLSLRMRSQITNQRRKDATEDSETRPSFTAESVWGTILSVWEDEAKLIAGVSFQVSKLESWSITSKKVLENEIDLDDAAWKRVCDAARTEMKVGLRYKQTMQQVEKVRQRASSKELALSQRGSVDSSDEIVQSQKKNNDSSISMAISNRSIPGTLTPNRVGRALFKGGEAMKKLTSNAIGQIAKVGLTEVDQKEAKDQLALQEASTEKKRAVLAYETQTKELISKIDSEDDSGWSEIKDIILELTKNIKAFKEVRCAVFQNRISRETKTILESLTINAKKWSHMSQKKILNSEIKSASTKSPEHALSIQSITSDNIDVLLGMIKTDLTLPKLNVDTNSMTKQPEDQAADTGEWSPLSRTQIEIDTNEEFDKTQKSPAATSTSSTPVPESGKEKYLVAASTDIPVVPENNVTPEQKAFIKQFWSKKPKDQKAPNIIGIYACSYRPKERMTFLTPVLQGRLYTTKDAIYFLAAYKNFTLQWQEVISIEKVKGFMVSSNDTDLVVTYRFENIVSSFLLCRFRDRNAVLTNLRRLKADSDMSKVSNASENRSAVETQLPAVPPDSLQKNMEIVVSKRIKNTSVESVFENVWADRSKSKSFYGSWLDEEECFDIGMGEWEIAEPGKKFRNEWCNEQYDQRRVVTFKFNRTTHLYIGPPVAIVKQRHFIRVEENDRCVLAISAEFEGIPYADTFEVEMRWIATREGAHDVLVNVGLFVVIKKNTMLKSQIKSGTVTETKHVHLRLFDAVKKACKTTQNDQPDDDDDDDDTYNEKVEEEEGSTKGEQNFFAKLGNLASFLDASVLASSIGVVALLFAGRYCTQFIFGYSSQSDIQRLENRIQELKDEVHALHKSLDLVTVIVKDVQSKFN